ncbi:MAG: hypothetical protein ACTSW4_03795, partial [Candidatus Ranarchaeia archaeon]
MRRSVALAISAVTVLMILHILVGVTPVQASPATTTIFYISSDKNSYQVGENITITASYKAEYEVSTGYAVSSIGIGYSSDEFGVDYVNYYDLLSLKTYTETINFSLNPSDWPLVTHSMGYASVYIFAEDMFGSDGSTLSLPFNLTKADQYMDRVDRGPIIVNESAKATYLFYNRNNQKYVLSNHLVQYQVTFPDQSSSKTIFTYTNQSGYVSVQLNTSTHGAGVYSVNITSSSSTEYNEYNIQSLLYVYPNTTDDFRTPVEIKTNTYFHGYTKTGNYSITFVDEPVEISLTLLELPSYSPLSGQVINLTMIGASNSDMVTQFLKTNSTGKASFFWTPRVPDTYPVNLTYPGNGTIYASASVSETTIEVDPRPVNITVIHSPSYVNNYSGAPTFLGLQILDAINGTGISGLNCTFYYDLIHSNQWSMTDENGDVLFNVTFPSNVAPLIGTDFPLRFMASNIEAFQEYDIMSRIQDPISNISLFSSLFIQLADLNTSFVTQNETIYLQLEVKSPDGIFLSHLNATGTLVWSSVLEINFTVTNGDAFFPLTIPYDSPLGNATLFIYIGQYETLLYTSSTNFTL